MEITRCDFCSESFCEFCLQDIYKLSDSQKEFVNKIKAEATEHTLLKFMFMLGNEVDSYKDDVLGVDVIKVSVLQSIIQDIAEQLKEQK